MLLGSAHVAFGDSRGALAFERVLERKPGHSLNPFDLPPKVLEVGRKPPDR